LPTCAENNGGGWLPKPDRLEWSWDRKSPTHTRVDADLVAAIKGENASNDNYPKVLFIESELSLAPEPEAEAA
jgi:hypothetical protein